jgi:hypothetical protein
MTPDEVRKIREEYAETMQLAGELRESAEKVRTGSMVYGGLFGRFLLWFANFADRKADEKEAQSRERVRKTYPGWNP